MAVNKGDMFMASILSYNTERKYGVQTCVIAVDFNEGRPVFEKIRTGLEDKDIAILGE